MISKSEDTQITSFLLDYSENQLSRAELQSFESLMDLTPELKREAMIGRRVHLALQSLPKKGVRSGFDQRMAARFAMELDRETAQQNRSRIVDRDLTVI
ncbi:hypothetical protein [Rhodohalobacter halophilus]|uniref:hypothetical protein n=1 Tax=Rhodohalobacter halophilus TaxID=1812810 RepID=UPI00083F573F|nr:hypothetical protein [Rhodohalobacter halophilus]